MTPRQPITAAMLLALLLAADPATARAQSARELRDRAADLTYNLDHDEAIRLLRQAVAAEPDNSANHRALASTIWLDILFIRGAVTVDHYLGSFTKASVEVRNPPAGLDAEFKREIARAIELAERRAAAAPRDAQAQVDLGTAVGLQASYIASVEGRLMAGFRAARRSYDAEETAHQIDPGRKEAGLIVGMAMLAGDRRARIPGEDALWHYKRGAARVMLRRRDAALADLRAALAPGAAGWVQGRAHLELARLALQQGDRQGALREAADAMAACGRSSDSICGDEARRRK